MPVFQLSNKIGFPPPHLAEREGLLAVGGDLSLKRLILAYKMGIFPWYSEDDPIIWWSPDPRLILYPDELKISKSLKKILNKGIFQVTLDQAFDKVIMECAAVRSETGEGTWIVDEMIEAYCRLHRAGLAHSVETWINGHLAGGLYGVSLGKCFFGESMFMRVSNASKVAFVSLVQQLSRWSFDFIDCQVKTRHLMSFGAREVSRKVFLDQLQKSLKKKTLRGQWELDKH
ncbi:Leucyl/phenylalanyl-tRNA--protein transferase [Desulfonema limicola]|uniref:Leucyl/phenylalanyl-tRNA--protein transferase n=1 Tax=Desulfonema limicola TaxID=45656 RepID=A0A975BA53_9BACT|nr:leucyl/phenylalanyl-tRNA--protein transferase [Desulfonema limicola]QTA81565.1 Leucyl/phenylalanyl-tRNA--protein transferase [Desulfonema limicola]